MRESIIVDISDTGGDADAGQVVAFVESTGTDESNAGRDLIGARDSTGSQKQLRFLFIKQNTAVIAGIVLVICIHVDFGQAGALIESIFCDEINAG